MSDQLRGSVSEACSRLGRNPSEVDALLDLLQRNWYDSVESLAGVSPSELSQLGVPLRLAKELLDPEAKPTQSVSHVISVSGTWSPAVLGHAKEFRPVSPPEDRGGDGVSAEADLAEISEQTKLRADSGSSEAQAAGTGSSPVSSDVGPEIHERLRAPILAECGLDELMPVLLYGWVVGPCLLEFVGSLAGPLLLSGPMPAEELAGQAAVELGPLMLVLRSCSLLGYVGVEPMTRSYRAIPGPDLDVLGSLLGGASEVAVAMRAIYNAVLEGSSCMVPVCVNAWEQHHKTLSQRAANTSIGPLLDGIFLVPLLAALVKSCSWTSGIDTQLQWDENYQDQPAQLNFPNLTPAELAALDKLLSRFPQVGFQDGATGITLTRSGSRTLRRWSRQLLCATAAVAEIPQFRSVLHHSDSDQCAVQKGRSRAEVAAGQQSMSIMFDNPLLHRSLLHCLRDIFDRADFGAQPRSIAVAGCEEGQLLLQVYRYVQASTRRGSVLAQYPLVMVGVCADEGCRSKTAATLECASVPHCLVIGHFCDSAALRRASVNPDQTLHVRMLMESTRTYSPPLRQLDDQSAAAAFAWSHLRSVLQPGQNLEPIRPNQAFASLLEHFERLSESLVGSMGVCLAEVSAFEASSNVNCLHEGVALYQDLFRCIFRHQAVPASVLALAAAGAGLLPASLGAVRTDPSASRYPCRSCHAVSHLVQRPFRIRLAELSDLPDLVELERLAWAEHLRAPPEVLATRLQTSPTTNLVCTLNGRLVAALFMQRISSEADIDQQTFLDASKSHVAAGKLLQFIAISANPEVNGLNIGSELRSLALLLGHLDQSIEGAVAVTRARSFHSANAGQDFQDYVNAHVQGRIVDGVIGFHTNFGAKVRRLVPGFRPQDIDNGGCGVLVRYDLSDLSLLGRSPFVSAGSAVAERNSPAGRQTDGRAIVASILANLGYEVDLDNPLRGFFEYGIDSVEIGQFHALLSSVLGLQLPKTILFDFPSAVALGDHLDKLLCPADTPIRSQILASKDPKEQRVLGEVEPVGDALLSWALLASHQLVSILKECRTNFEQPSYQRQLARIAEKCYPNKLKYISNIEPLCEEVEGIVLHSWGLIPDQEHASVQEGMARMSDAVMQFWSEVVVRAAWQDILKVSGQDSTWPRAILCHAVARKI
ncbi:unnamed protein product [Polarella glacialis]|uniref:Carrier domain-containing protein n=1 Tax=Polarella glacialis TaxID=89957 RepID=A0A813ILZ8_POLGL|nr:unnamed protein product [Polarella glacialis]